MVKLRFPGNKRGTLQDKDIVRSFDYNPNEKVIMHELLNVLGTHEGYRKENT